MKRMYFLKLRSFCDMAGKALPALLFAMFLSITTFAQTNGTIKGIVTDENNAPLPGVTVSIKGTSNGTITNANGAYTIVAKGPGDVILFTLMGSLPKEITV